MSEWICNLFQGNRSASAKNIGRQVGVSHIGAWRAVKENLQHPYYFQKIQESIFSEDFIYIYKVFCYTDTQLTYMCIKMVLNII